MSTVAMLVGVSLALSSVSAVNPSDASGLLEAVVRAREEVVSGDFVVRRTYEKEGKPKLTPSPANTFSTDYPTEFHIFLDGEQLRTDVHTPAKEAGGTSHRYMSLARSGPYAVLNYFTGSGDSSPRADVLPSWRAVMLINPRRVGLCSNLLDAESIRDELMPPDTEFAVVGQEQRDDTMTIIVETRFPAKPYRGRKMWIAPDRDFSLVRAESWSRREGQPEYRTVGEIELYQTDSGRWFARRAVWEQFREDELLWRRTHETLEAHINTAMRSETFTFAGMGVPPDAEILDLRLWMEMQRLGDRSADPEAFADAVENPLGSSMPKRLSSNANGSCRLTCSARRAATQPATAPANPAQPAQPAAQP